MPVNLGVSLPYDYLCGKDRSPEAAALREAFGPSEAALEALIRHGARAVEIRHFSPEVQPERIVEAARAIWRAGLSATLHPATPPGCEVRSLVETFPWLTALAGGLPAYQRELLLTIHACAEATGDPEGLAKRTEALFGGLARLANNDGASLLFALELNRAKGVSDPSVTYRGVLRMCEAVGQPRVGICWDWGHAQANVEGGLLDAIPPSEFVRRVIHTHVHDMSPEGQTHWPLDGGRVPVARNARLLRRAGYRGLYCLELSPDRFQGRKPVAAAFLEGLRLLAGAAS